MSRTYRKNLRMNTCCGSNTDFYRKRNRYYRRKRNQQLTKIRKLTIEDFSDTYLDPKYPKKDTWREPTDGYFLLTKEEAKKLLNKQNNSNYINNLLVYAKRHLKSFHKN